jgi:protein-tyrosine phosphatase
MEDDGQRRAGENLTYTKMPPDFSWLMDGLAVGGCFAADDIPALANEHRIAAVIDLRDEACDDEEALLRAGIAFLHLPTADMHPPPPDMLDKGVAFAREYILRGEPVLIHCMQGVGRSPLLALCVMVDQGMEPLAALAQAKDRRAYVSPSEAQYLGWADWLARRGQPVPDYHAFGCIAYRHLA